MKTIVTSLITAAIFLANAALALDFHAGPDIFARAYERVDRGTYEVTGDGLLQGFSIDVDYDGVYSQEDLMKPLRLIYQLKFSNYKEVVNEKTEILDSDGNVVFMSNTGWVPEENLSEDGKQLSYSIPSWAGSIYLELADQVLEFDGDWALANMGGYSFNLEVQDGHVTVPGWIYSRNGTFQYSEGGKVFAFDIQTGLPVLGGQNLIFARAENVRGLETVYSVGMNLTISDVYIGQYWDNLVYEHTLIGNGSLLVKASGRWGEIPEGVYYTITGSGFDPIYVKAINGVCIIPNMRKGEAIHLKFYWDEDAPKG